MVLQEVAVQVLQEEIQLYVVMAGMEEMEGYPLFQVFLLLMQVEVAVQDIVVMAVWEE